MKKDKKPIIGIIGGKGKMGGWFYNFFIKSRFKVLISDVNTSLTNEQLAKKSDIIIVSVPIRKTVEVIEEIRSSVKKDALLCDIASLKVKPIEAMKKAKSGVLGMHPLFGPLTPGLEGQTIVFCHVRDNKWVDFLENIFISNRAKIISVSAEEHDKQVAVMQALIHFINISLAKTLYSGKWILNPLFFTPVFRLQSLILGRILGQKAELFAEIEMENPYFPRVLANFEKEFSKLSNDIKNKNFNNFIKKFNETSKHLDGFRKIAETKSTEVLRIIDYQPLKIKSKKSKINFENIKVGFLGPAGTFSNEAAKKIFSEKTKFIPLLTIKEVFEEVNNHKIDFGVVPFENSNTGIVFETIHNLINYPIKVTGSFDFKVHQCLLSRSKTIEEIKMIMSHEQALSQCKNWLAKNLPYIKKQNVSSTISPIIEKKGKEIGFIGSKIAAKIYGLNVLSKNIEDNKDNFTKFYIISNDIYKEVQKKLNAKKTLMLFAVYDRVGILRDILNVFAKNNLNLTALHSIPSRLKIWDYFFFVEIESPYPSSKIKKVIRGLDKYCSIIRIIGAS